MSDTPADFDDLLEQAQRPVLGYLIRLTGSMHAAQDLLQMANVTAISKQSSFAVGTDFVAWLRTIAMNHFRNHARKQAGERQVPLVDSDLHELIERRHRERIEAKHQVERWQRVMNCVERLPEHQHDVVLRFYLHGQSLRQIAQVLNRTANAVGQTLHRARSAVVRCVHQPLAESPSPPQEDLPSNSVGSSRYL